MEIEIINREKFIGALVLIALGALSLGIGLGVILGVMLLG